MTDTPEPIDMDRLARRLAEYEQFLDEVSSPLHYGATPSREKFIRDKEVYLEEQRKNQARANGYPEPKTDTSETT